MLCRKGSSIDDGVFGVRSKSQFADEEEDEYQIQVSLENTTNSKIIYTAESTQRLLNQSQTITHPT